MAAPKVDWRVDMWAASKAECWAARMVAMTAIQMVAWKVECSAATRACPKVVMMVAR
jgi:hypothetical protein